MAGWYGVNIQAPDNAELIDTAMKANELAGQHYGNALKGLGSIISNSREQERQAQKEIQASNANMLNTLATARDREIKDLERQELKDKTLATNNALAILMDPSKATSLHTPASELTTQNQINMYNQANSDGVVTPQEQALIDARYKEDLSKDISSNKSVDQSVMFNAQKQKEDIALKQQQLEADIDFKNKSLVEQVRARNAQEKRYNEQRVFENDIKKQNFEARQRELSQLEQNKNLLIQQTIAGGGDPRAMTMDQMKDFVTEKGKTNTFISQPKASIDPNTGKEILTNSLAMVPKGITESDIKKNVEEMTKGYSSLKENLASNEDLLSSKTDKTLRAAEMAGVDPAVMKSLISSTSIENANNLMFDAQFDYDSKAVKNTIVKDNITGKQVPLDILLKTISESNVMNQYTEKGYKGFGSLINLSEDEKQKFSEELDKAMGKQNQANTIKSDYLTD